MVFEIELVSQDLAKISFQAFFKKMTLAELFLDQIQKSFGTLYESHMEYPNALITKFGLLMSGDLSSVFSRLIEFELEHKKFVKAV